MNFILKKKDKGPEREVEAQIFEERLLKRLDEKYNKFQSFAERFNTARKVALGVSYLFNLFSYCTAAFFLYSLMSQVMVQLPAVLAVPIAIITGPILALGLEYLKRSTAAEIFNEGLSQDNWTPLGISFLLLIQGLSIFLSFKASQNLPNEYTEKPMVQEIASSFSSPWDERIGRATEEIKKIREERLWKGRLSTIDQEEINKINDRIAAIEDEKTAAIAKERERVAAENKAARAAYTIEVDAQQYILGWVTVVTESLFVLCFFFIEYYDWKAAKERMKLEEQPSAQTIINQQPAVGSHNSGQRAPQVNRQIGFKYGSPPPPEEEKTELPTPSERAQTEAVHNSTEAVHIQEDEKKNTDIILEDFLEVPEKELCTPSERERTEYVILDNKKPCEECGKLMDYKYTRKKYCSAKCRAKANRKL